MTVEMVLSLLGSSVSLVAFSFLTFATKKELERVERSINENKLETDKKLERIESKIDRLIEREILK